MKLYLKDYSCLILWSPWKIRTVQCLALHPHDSCWRPVEYGKKSLSKSLREGLSLEDCALSHKTIIRQFRAMPHSFVRKAYGQRCLTRGKVSRFHKKILAHQHVVWPWELKSLYEPYFSFLSLWAKRTIQKKYPSLLYNKHKKVTILFICKVIHCKVI